MQKKLKRKESSKPCLYLVLFCVCITYLLSFKQVVYSEEIRDEDTTTESTFQLVQEKGKERKTVYDNCGSVTIVASRSLVSVIIRQKMGWIYWSFTGDVTDTLGNNHHFYLYSTGNTSLSESYELWTKGYRTLTLTGEATDISGTSCYVSPDAYITHKWS